MYLNEWKVEDFADKSVHDYQIIITLKIIPTILYVVIDTPFFSFFFQLFHCQNHFFATHSSHLSPPIDFSASLKSNWDA